MYKPHMIEQYKVQQLLDHTSVMGHFLVSPLSRSALMLEDRCGERIALSFSDNEVRGIPIPSAPSSDKVESFIRSFWALGAKPYLHTFEDVTRQWLNHPNPLTYQQALGLPDEFYRRFLFSILIEDEDVQRLTASGLISEDAYQDTQLWYLNGNAADCWLGPLGIDGTGNFYAPTFNYGTFRARELKFCLLDDYYCHMNHILQLVGSKYLYIVLYHLTNTRHGVTLDLQLIFVYFPRGIQVKHLYRKAQSPALHTQLSLYVVSSVSGTATPFSGWYPLALSIYRQ